MLQIAYGYVRADADASCAVMLLCSACIGYFAGPCMHHSALAAASSQKRHSSLRCALLASADPSQPWYWEATLLSPSIKAAADPIS